MIHSRIQVKDGFEDSNLVGKTGTIIEEFVSLDPTKIQKSLIVLLDGHSVPLWFTADEVSII